MFFDKVFYRFYIVVSDTFNLLYSLGSCHIEFLVNGAQLGEQSVRERSQLRERQLTERNKVLNLHPDTVANECIFRKIVC